MTKIFDCTIRDGGHLNNWDFSDECFINSVRAAQNSGSEYFEAGYRSFSEGGKFVRCIDEDIKNILPENISLKIAVMLNVRDYKENLFAHAKNSPIAAVRVACHKEEIVRGMEICGILKNLGYEVFLHLMAVAELDENDYKILAGWTGKKCLTSLYFADSYGGFFNSDIELYYKKLESLGFENISFHAHNNLQMAFSNSLKAIELGAFSVDGSIYGMGRGSGNLPVEMLVGHLAKTDKKLNSEPYFDVVTKFYESLNREYTWGYSLKNMENGLKNIHP